MDRKKPLDRLRSCRVGVDDLDNESAVESQIQATGQASSGVSVASIAGDCRRMHGAKACSPSDAGACYNDRSAGFVGGG